MTQIYFLRHDDSVKIGISKNVPARISSLTARLLGDVEVLASIDGSPAMEQALHVKLASLRIKGEWFRDCEELRRAIEDFRERGGDSLPAYEEIISKRQRRENILSAPLPPPAQRSEAADTMSELLSQVEALGMEMMEIYGSAKMARRTLPLSRLIAILPYVEIARAANRVLIDNVKIALADDFTGDHADGRALISPLIASASQAIGAAKATLMTAGAAP